MNFDFECSAEDLGPASQRTQDMGNFGVEPNGGRLIWV